MYYRSQDRKQEDSREKVLGHRSEDSATPQGARGQVIFCLQGRAVHWRYVMYSCPTRTEAGQRGVRLVGETWVVVAWNQNSQKYRDEGDRKAVQFRMELPHRT